MPVANRQALARGENGSKLVEPGGFEVTIAALDAELHFSAASVLAEGADAAQRTLEARAFDSLALAPGLIPQAQVLGRQPTVPRDDVKECSLARNGAGVAEMDHDGLRAEIDC